MADLAALYRDKSPSPTTKGTLLALHLGIVLVALWLLLGGGIGRVDGLLGRATQLAGVTRRGALAAAAVLYLARTVFTILVFVRRRMGWREVSAIVLSITTVDLLFAYFGGRNPGPFAAAGTAGALLVIAGSALNTGSEWQRYRWKRRPENQGHLMTRGLFGYARHINYFGDVVLFTGWALMTGRPALLVIPALMLLGFAYVNVPAQDRYLAERYGDEYREHARHTALLIPYLY
jgi:protein-S-isoprenylcysteine O-methyltransferase Ste14